MLRPIGNRQDDRTNIDTRFCMQRNLYNDYHPHGESIHSDCEVEDFDPGHGYLFACRWNTHEIALVDAAVYK